MATNPELEVEGLSANEVYAKLIDVKVNRSDAAILTSSWIVEALGRAQRTFNYTEQFPAIAPGCGAAFARTFQHTDWTDGESVVQAGETPTEDGFNKRFHQIESDLDAVGRDAAKAFACVADMRQSLRRMFDEVRAELNRLNAEVHQLRNGRPGVPSIPPINVPPFVELFENPQFMGATVIGDRPVQIWNTGRGPMVLPVVNTLPGDVVMNPRVNKAASFTRYMAESANAREFLTEARPVAEFVKQFGGEQVRPGLSVAEAVAMVPGDTRLNATGIVDAVAEREAAALRTTAGAREVVTSAFGLEASTEQVSQAKLDRVQSIPPQIRAVMVLKGIGTVGDLAKAKPDELQKVLTTAGVQSVTIGDVAEWTGMAKTFTHLG
jgi:hypothetical protein